MEEENDFQQTNCTSSGRSVFGSRIAPCNTNEDGNEAPSGMVGLIAVATFLLIFVMILGHISCASQRGPTKRQKRERAKYIDERLTKKRVEKKDKVSAVDTDKESLEEMEEGTKANDLQLDQRLQTKGSKVYISFCEDDMTDQFECSIHGDVEDLEPDQKQEHASIPPCPICKEHYHEKDMICWPKNEQCCHAFHVECIKPWLMYHAKCPVCRKNYLGPKQGGGETENQRVLVDGMADQATGSIPEHNSSNSPASLAQQAHERGNEMAEPQTIPGAEPIPERVESEPTASLAQALQEMYHIQAESVEFHGGTWRIRSTPTVRVRSHR